MLAKLVNKLLGILGNRAEKRLIKNALQSHEQNIIQAVLAQLSGDYNSRVREIVPKIRNQYSVKSNESAGEEGPIFCYDCKVKKVSITK